MHRKFGQIVAVFFALVWVGTSIANVELCGHEGVVAQAKSAWSLSCVTTCEAIFKNQSPAAEAYFRHNCENFAQEDSKPVDIVAALKSHALAYGRLYRDCVVGAPVKAISSGVELIEGILTGEIFGTPEFAKSWQKCTQVPSCLRALARNMVHYRQRQSDGSWAISDDQLDREIVEMTPTILLIRSQAEQELTVQECMRSLGPGRIKDPEKMFNLLAATKPYCIGALKLTPPGDFHRALPLDRAECLKTSAKPADCLSLSEMVAVGTVCAGDQFSQKLEAVKVDLCTDILSFVIPIPRVNTVTRILSRGDEALTGASELAASKLASDSTSVLAAAPQTARGFLSGSKVQAFMDQFKTYNPVPVAQNKRFIDAVKDSALRVSENRIRVFSAELPVLQDINTLVGEKNLGTSLINYQKKVFIERLQGFEKRHPELRCEIFGGDFKSIQLSITNSRAISRELDAKLTSELEALFKEANAEFTKHLKDIGIAIPELGDPSTWMKAAYGESYEMTALTSKQARRETGAPQLYQSTNFQTVLQARLDQTTGLIRSLSKSQNLAPLFEKGASGEMIIKQDVFDMIKKNKSDDALIKAVTGRYSVSSLSNAEVGKLRLITQNVNDFTSPLLSAERVNVNLDEAALGGLTADFLGMGSANLYHTADAIASQTHLSDAVQAARRAEIKVTSIFQGRMEKFKKTVGGEVNCTGDDCVRIFTERMSDEQKTKIVNNLARNSETRAIRLAFIADDVPQEFRMSLASQGELIEKDFRKAIQSKIGSPKLSQKLDQMTFGFEMPRTANNQGTVNLIVGRAQGVSISAQESQQMEEAFALALQEANKRLNNFGQGTIRTQSKTVTLIPGPFALLSSLKATQDNGAPDSGKDGSAP